MIKKDNFKIISLIFFLLFSQSAWAEKYRLACKIGAFNLEGTAFQDKTRFYNKNQWTNQITLFQSKQLFHLPCVMRLH